MQIYIDMFKTFCQKNKRYFGALGLFVLLIVVLVRFAAPQEAGSSNVGTDTEIPNTEGGASVGDVLTGELSHEADEELDSLIHGYYEAYVDADIETLESLASPITDNEKSYIATFSEYYEEYQNVECYYVKEEEEHYFVSSCYDLKFKDIETPAPGMDFFYVERDGKGNLSINNIYSAYNFSFMEKELDASVYAKILSYEQKPEVVDLQKQVQTRYEAAVTSDEVLAAFVGGTIRTVIAQWRESLNVVDDVPNTENTDTQTPENGENPNAENPDAQTPENGENPEAENPNGDNPDAQEPNEDDQANEPELTTYTVKALANCNIRAEASTHSAVVGQVRKGAKLTAVSEENNWIKLDFNGETGYIRSDLVKNAD